MKLLGEAAMDLPWLSPSADSLLALVRSPLAAVWPQSKCDPGLVLLTARAWGAHLPFHRPRACEIKVLDSALQSLRCGPGAGFADWLQPELAGVYHGALRQAALAAALAERAGDCDVDRAWAAGLSASLGWLAVCVADPAQTKIYLAKGIGVGRRRHGEFDPAAVARRLSRRWQLPAWLATVAGHLGLSADLAARLGTGASLFRVVQLAVLLRQREDSCALLRVGAHFDELLPALRLTVEATEQAVEESRAELPVPSRWESPASQPLMVDLLELTLRDRRRDDQTRLRLLHQDVDRLHEALEARREEDRRRVQTQKLASLAEFAAGAGHEINNPLAVISGQAQYLVRQLELLDGPADEIDNPAEYLANLKTQLVPSLQKIVGQTHRIHGILTDLMQFARPPLPRVQPLDVGQIIHDVAAGLQALADERGVRLVCVGPEAPLAVQADPVQVRASLTALLRNAVEAAPGGGWAGVRVDREECDRLVLAIEDSGPGPSPVALEHLFDPFFSGRSAGRGRGMGLPTAWRLACQQDGDVRFDGTHDGVTRFSLILPSAAPLAPSSPPAYANGRNGSAHHSE